jgi:hypothetical protein
LHSLIQVGDERIDVNPVSLGALFDILKPSGSAAKATHTVITEYFNGLGIFLDYLDNTKIFSDNQEVDPPFRKNFLDHIISQEQRPVIEGDLKSRRTYNENGKSP